jgi:16S rRNA processing protein RimM
VARARPDKSDYWLMHLEGIDDREAADRLRGRYILVALGDAVPLEPGEVYLFQLIGLDVLTAGGARLGAVAEIIETGANDVLVVRGGPYGEVLLPVIEPVIKKIDLAARTLLVDPLPGLLPDPPTQKDATNP